MAKKIPKEIRENGKRGEWEKKTTRRKLEKKKRQERKKGNNFDEENERKNNGTLEEKVKEIRGREQNVVDMIIEEKNTSGQTSDLSEVERRQKGL